jgi:hypothetical protein
MQNRISNVDNRRGGEPQHIGEILTELFAQYQDRFPSARIAVVQTPAVTEDQSSCLFYPAELANVS